MEALVIFFVLVGLASALAAQTICRADQGISRQLAEERCRHLETELRFVEPWSERRD